MRIRDALEELDLLDPAAVDELLGYGHVTPEYVEDWVEHRRWNKHRVGGGFYRMQIRNRRVSPYAMEPRDRSEFRWHKDREYGRPLPEQDEQDGEDQGEAQL